MATEELLLESEITVPPLGAKPLRVTSPVEGLPPLTLVGFRVMEDRVEEPCGRGPTVTVCLAAVHEFQQSEATKSPSAAGKPRHRAGRIPRRRDSAQTKSHATQHPSKATETKVRGGRLLRGAEDTARAVV